MGESRTAGGGIGFTGLLTVAFIVLKLTGTIGWSWFWVLAPIWITAGIVLLIVIAVVIGALIKYR